MKATVEAKTLAHAVGIVAPFVPRYSHLPALSMIRVDADDEGLRFTASDLEHTCSTVVEATVHDTGTMLAPTHVFTRTVGRFDGDVTLAVDDGELSLTGADRRVSMRTGDVDDWPRLTWPDVDGQPFDDAAWDRVQRVMQSASVDDARPVLCGVRFEDGCVVATDSYRMAWATCPEGIDALVPAEALRRAAKNLDGPPTMTTTLQEAVFTAGATSIMTRLIDGEYPKWRGLTRDASPHTLTVDTAALAEAAATVAALPHDPKSPWPVRLDFDHDVLTVSGAIQDVGAAQVTLPAAGTWPGTVGFNPHYLAGALAVAGCDEIQLQVVDAKKPAMISGGDINQLLMPVRGTA